jgi:replicative DNA helicase
MNVEQALLGCVLGDNNTYWDASRHVAESDFEDGRLGAVWQGIGRVLASGGAVDKVSVVGFFPDWEVRGIDAAAPWVWGEAAGFAFYQAPVLAKQVAKAAARRFGREALTAGLIQLGDTGVDPDQVLAETVRKVQARDTHTAGLEAVSLREILAMEESYDWVIPNLMERKDRLILTGYEGMGKSMMARQLILLPAAGLHPFTFERIEPIRALVIDAENTAKQWKRNSGYLAHQAQLQGGHDPAERTYMAISGRVDILDPRTQGQIHRLIDRHDPQIVFIGPLYRIAMKLNSDDEVAPVIAALDAIRDRNVALVMEAHAGHATDSTGDRGVRPRGSSALMGWPEFGFGIRPSMTDDEYEFVAWRGQREQRDWPETLRRGNWKLAEFPWVPA